jgi:hypothetical protein
MALAMATVRCRGGARANETERERELGHQAPKGVKMTQSQAIPLSFKV